MIRRGPLLPLDCGALLSPKRRAEIEALYPDDERTEPALWSVVEMAGFDSMSRQERDDERKRAEEMNAMEQREALQECSVL